MQNPGGSRAEPARTLNDLEEVDKWVPGFGEHATVIEAKELRDRMEQTAKAIQQK